jgi:hypothetical protein
VKELIKYILREETKDYRSGILDIINKKGLFTGAKILGGINNLKKVFKDNDEIINKIERQKGLLEVRYHPDKEVAIRFVLPFNIIGKENNVWNTNNWGVINLIYDESKLTEEENNIFKLFLVDAIVHDGVSEVVTNESNEFRDSSYVTLSEINGVPIERIGDPEGRYPYERVEEIISKLQDKTNIYESRNSALNFLKRRVSYDEINEAINRSIRFVNGFRDREEMDGNTFERIVLDATMDDFHSILSDGGYVNFDYDGIHNGLHQLFHDYIMDKYVEYNNENDILMEEITKRKTGERFEDLPKKDQMNVRVVYNFLLANHLILTEILKDYILHVDEDADEIAYMISKKDGEVHIDYKFQDKLIKLIKDEGYRGDLVEMASYIYLDKHLPKEIKFDSNQRLGGGNISIYRH